MTIERFFIADPYNEEHISMYENFEQENNITTKTTSSFRKIQQEYSKEQYLELSKKSNEIKQNLFSTVDGKIKDCCYIQGVKDMKTCSLFFAPLNSKNRPLLTFVTDYAQNILNMEEVFTQTEKEDRNLQKLLISKGYESLGEEGNLIEFVKEKEMVEENKIGRAI